MVTESKDERAKLLVKGTATNGARLGAAAMGHCGDQDRRAKCGLVAEAAMISAGCTSSQAVTKIWKLPVLHPGNCDDSSSAVDYGCIGMGDGGQRYWYKKTKKNGQTLGRLKLRFMESSNGGGMYAQVQSHTAGGRRRRRHTPWITMRSWNWCEFCEDNCIKVCGCSANGYNHPAQYALHHGFSASQHAPAAAKFRDWLDAECGETCSRL